jgi:hypothetical protein
MATEEGFVPTAPMPAKHKLACQGLFDDLVRCLSDSSCVINHPNRKAALSDCADPDANGVDDKCKITRAAYS